MRFLLPFLIMATFFLEATPVIATNTSPTYGCACTSLEMDCKLFTEPKTPSECTKKCSDTFDTFKQKIFSIFDSTQTNVQEANFLQKNPGNKTEETAYSSAVAACTKKHEDLLRAKKNAEDSAAIINPILNVPIPNLSFTKGVMGPCEHDSSIDCVKTNFLGEYINGIFNFLLGSGLIIVIVIVMVGGFQYALGAVSPGQISEGKRRINQAITGFILLISVFVILKTINPQLTLMKTLEAIYVNEAEFDFGPNTLSPEEQAQADSSNPGPYKFKYFQNCPVQLNNQIVLDDKGKPGDIRKNIPRRIEFHNKIRGLITGTISERITKAAEAAAQCKIRYENCGVATTNIHALAATPGSYGDRCLANDNAAKGYCNILGNSVGNIRKKTIHNALSAQTSYGLKVSSLLKGFFCPSVSQCPLNKKDPSSGRKVGWKEPCIPTKAQAASTLRNILSQTGKWSANWIDELQPGDYYMVVNWNPSCQSTHSAVFLGWQDKANKIGTVVMSGSAMPVKIGTNQFKPDDIVLQISRPID